MTQFLWGFPVTILLCSVAIFFAEGGFVAVRRKLGKEFHLHKKVDILLAVGMFLTNIYSLWLYGFCREYLAFMLLITYLAAMTVTDLKTKEIADDATAFFALAFLIFRITSFDMANILGGVLGLAFGGLLPLLAYLVKKDAIGFGDVKLLACIGLISGFPDVMYIFMRALVLIFVFSVIQLIRRKFTFKSEVPFVPFILIGALL